VVYGEHSLCLIDDVPEVIREARAFIKRAVSGDA
jgi:hypothetical protein